MLKYRLIFGTLFSALFVGLIWLDSYASRGWPAGGAATPPGMFVALVTLAVIPLALWEMRGLLARENVQISMRITVVAATLCMLWPWMEQVAESTYPKFATFEITNPTSNPAYPSLGPGTLVPNRPGTLAATADASSWSRIGRWFRTVKPHYLVPTILAISLVAAFIMHSHHKRVDGAMANAGGTLLAIVYLGVLPGFFLPICMTHSAWMVLAIVGVVKSADIGGYTAGHMMGRHKLIPWLSPGKTVEGFFGGLIFAAVVGAGVAALFHEHGPERWKEISWGGIVVGGALCGVILGGVGQLGDLLESLLKRDAGVKDSGAVPGLGGVLDILDSPLLAAPVAYWLLKLVVPGGGGDLGVG